jgi:hypothetical protein
VPSPQKQLVDTPDMVSVMMNLKKVPAKQNQKPIMMCDIPVTLSAMRAQHRG